MAKRLPNHTTILPSGVKVEYWDSVGVDGEPQRRRYLIDGERVPSVTTILGILDKPALLDWAARLAREGQDWRQVRDEAAKRGTAAHLNLHRIVTGQGATLGELDPEHRPWGQGGFRWALAREPEVIDGEMIVAGEGFAGRLDLLALIDGARTLCDAKSVTRWSYVKRKGKPTDELYPPYDENLLQLDLYQAGLIHSGYDPAERGLIVRLGPDGNYDETFVDLQPDRGLAILRAYRCKQAAHTELRDARKRVAA